MVCDFCVSPIVPTRETLCPASPSLQWVAWASLPHLTVQLSTTEHRYYDPLRLPEACLRFVRSSLSAPDTLPFRTRPHPDLPSSRVTPLRTCPGLRPRWCPAHSPCRLQDCCLPLKFTASTFSLYDQKDYPIGPQLYIFRGSIQSLYPRSIQLQTPVAGFACGFH